MNKILKTIIVLILLPVLAITSWAGFTFYNKKQDNKIKSPIININKLSSSILDQTLNIDNQVDNIEFLRSFVEEFNSDINLREDAILKLYVKDNIYYLIVDVEGNIFEYSYELIKNLV